MTYFKKDNYIYEIEDTRIYKRDGLIYQISYDLSLVCGIDYVPYKDHQGWIGKENFIDQVQSEVCSTFPLDESFKESLRVNGFEIVEHLPTIE